LQRDIDLLLDVLSRHLHGSAAGAGTASAATPEGLVEEVGKGIAVAEEVAQVVGVRGAILIARSARARPRPRAGEAGGGAQELRGRGVTAAGAVLLVLTPLRPELVVERAFLGIREHLVGLVELLEARLGLLVAGVNVGVILPRQLAEGGADLLLGGALLQPERGVIVFKFYSHTHPCALTSGRITARGEPVTLVLLFTVYIT